MGIDVSQHFGAGWAFPIATYLTLAGMQQDKLNVHPKLLACYQLTSYVENLCLYDGQNTNIHLYKSHILSICFALINLELYG